MARGFGVGIVLGIGLFAIEARAAEPPEIAEPARSVEFSAGAMGLLGGNYVTTPKNIPPPLGEGIGFAGDAGGFGWGIAAYGEARFIKHLGVELRLGYDHSSIHREVTYNGVGKVEEKLTIGSTRLGLMAKGILPTPFGRLWGGLGPQFVLGTSPDAENEITNGRQLLPPADAARIESAIHAKKKKSTLLDLGVGLAIHAGDLIEIPFEIRASKNLSQGDQWSDRVEVDPVTLNYSVTTQSSWEFRMGLGVGARF